MSSAVASPAAIKSARRFIGRKASACRKHGGADQEHHVNRMGGLVCSECSPPRTDADCVLRLVIRGGLWDDAENPFDNFEGPGGREPDGQPAATASRPGPKYANATAALETAIDIDEATTSELATPRDGAQPRTSRRVGEPLLDLEMDFFMSLPAGDMKSSANSEEIGQAPAAKESQEARKTEREKAGSLELGVQKSGFVGGIVRRGEGSGLSAGPPHSRALTKTQFAVGQVVRLLRRLETFRGPLLPGGGYVVSSSGMDAFGCPLVALSRGGEVVVSGLVPDAETIAADLPDLGNLSVDDLLG